VSRRFPRIVELVSGMFADADNGEAGFDGAAMRERVGTYVGVTVGFAFVPLYLFFALLAGDRIQTHLRDLLSVFGPEAEREIFYLITVFVNYITAFFRGQLVIALIMGVLYAIGFTIIGLKGAIFLGLFLGMLNIVPYLGAIVGLATALPIAYVQPDGGLALVGFALLVFAVVQSIESLLLTPKIMADRSGLHPAIVVISIFFWGALIGGLVGMILAVPLSAFVATVWRHFRMRIRRTVVSDETEREIFEHEEREARRIIMPSDARAARRR
jgi:predicted PurR-regulated permease PerM